MYGVFTRWIGDFVLIYVLEVCTDRFFHHLFPAISYFLPCRIAECLVVWRCDSLKLMFSYPRYSCSPRRLTPISGVYVRGSSSIYPTK